MPRRRRPAYFTLCLFRDQCVTYPARRPSIRTLIRRIEALGYEVFTFPRETEWSAIPQEDWSVVVGNINDSRQLFLIVPLPRRRRRLTRSGVILGSYEDEVSSSGR